MTKTADEIAAEIEALRHRRRMASLENTRLMRRANELLQLAAIARRDRDGFDEQIGKLEKKVRGEK